MSELFLFTRYRAADGNVTGFGSMPMAFAAVQPRAVGESVLVGASVQPSTHWVCGGAAVAYTPDQAAAKANKPKGATRWCNVSMAWLDDRTEAQRAADDLADVQAARRSAYPDVGEQLDALWAAMRDGVLPRVEPWFTQIEAVKAAHPKPGQ